MNNTDSTKESIDDLPDELLEYILSLVSPYKDLDACKLVSKRWLRTIKGVSQHAKSDLYRSVLNSNIVWQCKNPQESVPTITKRYSHAACYCDSAMYVFGGCTSTCTTFNDLWMLDLTLRQWVRPLTTGSYPSPKACATICCYKKSLLLFGGWTHPPPYPLHQTLRLFNELHTYDISSNRWSAVHSTVSPPPMAGHSSSIQGNLMVVFGGRQKTCTLGLYSSSNDVWSFNLDSQCWDKQETMDPKPYPRYGQSQIHLDEKNILIIGGCGGPNLILDDVWVLKMTEPMWAWQRIRVLNNHWAAPHMWCHPACRVSDLAVIFSRDGQSLISKLTVLARGSTTPPDASIPADVLARQASQGPSLAPRKDSNVNGQHGVLKTGHSAENLHLSPASTSFSTDDVASPEPSVSRDMGCDRLRDPQPHCSVQNQRFNDIQMAAFRDETTGSKPNSKNRMKQLESLKRLEARYKNKGKDEAAKQQKQEVPEPTPAPTPNLGSKMNMYVLEIGEVLSANPSVTWRVPHSNVSGPRDTILHSVVLGKGELVIFGGIEKDPTAMTQQASASGLNAVSNSLHFVTAPRSVI